GVCAGQARRAELRPRNRFCAGVDYGGWRCVSAAPERSLMRRNYSRLAPLSGVIAAILGLAGSALLIQHSAPGASASGAQVIAFYRAHHAGQAAGAILFTFAFIFFLFFAGTLRTF